MMDYLYFVTNFITGIGFFGVSFLFSLFVKRVEINSNTRVLDKDSSRKLWVMISKRSYLFSLMSAVFLCCGLGHLVEAVSPWAVDSIHMIVVHTCNASLGIALCLELTRSIFKNGKKD